MPTMMDVQACFPLGFVKEIREIIRLSVPMVITQVLQISFGPMSLIFCGRLGPISLACAALSTSLINVTGITVVMGLSAACDTLFTQTYGSPKRKKLGVLLQRAILILMLCLMPCFALHVNVERFLVVAGQNVVVAKLCGEFMLITIPGIAAFSVYMTVAKYVQCQGIVLPIMLIGAIANILCGVLHYVFIFVLDMGTNGSAWAITAGYCSLMVLSISYVLVSGAYKDTWDGFSLDLFREWSQFFKLAYSGLFMLGFEWWSFEVGVFLAGVLGTIDLDAQSIAFQIETMAYMLPFGVGFAASIRVGQCLGQGSADGAKTATRVALVFIVMTGVVMGILMGSLRSVLPRIFSDDERVISLASNVLPVLALYMVFDSLNGVGCGILRGMGRQLFGSGLMFVVYTVALVTGVPSLLLSPLGIQAYWWCLAASIMVESLVLSAILLRTNWNNEVNKALERTSIAAVAEYETLVEESSPYSALPSTSNGASVTNEAASKSTHLPEYRGKQTLIQNPNDEETSKLIGSKAQLLENRAKQVQNPKDDETSQILGAKDKPIRDIIYLRVVIIVGYVLVFVIGLIVRAFVPPSPLDLHMVTNVLNGIALNGTI